MMEKTILIYNNHTGVAQRMEPLFRGEGFRTVQVSDDQELLACLMEKSFHLMLVDVEFSAQGCGGGIELIAGLRARTAAPIIVVSAQTAETAQIMALNAGADDYVGAGCNPLELLARVKSQLRRYAQFASVRENISSIYKLDGLEMNDIQRSVSVDGREVRLTPIEYKILRLLLQERGRVLSISQIYEAIWHMDAIGADNTIAVHIRHIREKIEHNPKEPRYLKVVWGIGYKVG